ncbi:hypothetical protein [Natrialba sp. INN-245]|uniref:hypothetical protein n=1 Tax=Natrialba sp. INN-245 TaxID=2690967 RepID=UPI0013100AA1|nr:hypothetical protein [Natrialba sp. INN-245]MWV38906.1 hypothetical protein [Natrialba sp. INN-245]
MPVDRLIPEFLQRDDDAPNEDAVLHECRHCGSKFDEPVSQCPVCDSTEIATYEFPNGSSDEDESRGEDF